MYVRISFFVCYSFREFYMSRDLTRVTCSRNTLPAYVSCKPIHAIFNIVLRFSTGVVSCVIFKIKFEQPDNLRREQFMGFLIGKLLQARNTRGFHSGQECIFSIPRKSPEISKLKSLPEILQMKMVSKTQTFRFIGALVIVIITHQPRRCRAICNKKQIGVNSYENEGA